MLLEIIIELRYNYIKRGDWMVYRTHVMFAMSVAFIPVLTEEGREIYLSFGNTGLILALATVYLFSLLPDFDEPNSFLSRKFPFNIVSNILALFTRHRGITHRFVAIAVVVGLFCALIKVSEYTQYCYLGYFAAIAYFVHLLGDAMTVGGIKRFWYPLSKKTFWVIPKPFRLKLVFTKDGVRPGLKENFLFFIFSAIFSAELLLLMKTQVEQFLNSVS